MEKRIQIQGMLHNLLLACEKALLEMEHTAKCRKNICFHSPCTCGYDDFKKKFESILYEYNSL